MPTFTPQALHAVTHLIARRMGSDDAEASEVADHLVRANLAGHDSHGVGMLPAYVRLLHDGLLVPNQTPETVLDCRRAAGDRRPSRLRPAHGGRRRAPRDRPREGTGRLRAGAAQFGAYRAHRHVWRAGHQGRLRLHRLRQRRRPLRRRRRPGRAAKAGLAPTRSARRCRAQDGPALLLDMATTTIAAGKARVAFNKGVKVPEGCLIDDAGNPTTDPDRFHPGPHRRAAVVRQAQGLRPGGDVRDHGRGGGRRAACRRAGCATASSTPCWPR